MGYKPHPSQFHKPRLKLHILCSGLILALPLVLSFCGLEALAGGGRHGVVNFKPVGPLSPKMKDGAALIHQMHRHASALSDYSLIFETITFKEKETVSEKGRLYFKKPKLMRLEEIGEYKNGSVAVIGKDGKARAHAGGLVKFITLTMSADDKQLNAANGDRMLDSDFASLAALLERRLQEGNLARSTEVPAAYEGVEGQAYVLELYHQDNPEKVLKRIYVDPVSYLPVRWDDYDYKTPCSSTWSAVKVNPGLKDELFEL